jgi:hypothetical protein
VRFHCRLPDSSSLLPRLPAEALGADLINDIERGLGGPADSCEAGVRRDAADGRRSRPRFAARARDSGPELPD